VSQPKHVAWFTIGTSVVIALSYRDCRVFLRRKRSQTSWEL